MTNELAGLAGQIFLTLLCVYFAYKSGCQKERERYDKAESDCLSAARKARQSLCDSDVAERLHTKYKR